MRNDKWRACRRGMHACYVMCNVSVYCIVVVVALVTFAFADVVFCFVHLYLGISFICVLFMCVIQFIDIEVALHTKSYDFNGS